ncbi:RNA polymerase sigma factor SigF, partial [Streptomyces xanthophaeus]
MSDTQGSHRRGGPVPGPYEDQPAAGAPGEPEPAVPAPRGGRRARGRTAADAPAAYAPPAPPAPPAPRGTGRRRGGADPAPAPGTEDAPTLPGTAPAGP